MIPAATRAEYSPKLCPATTEGTMPFITRTLWIAVLTVRIQGWVLKVLFSSSAGPLKAISATLKPRALDASSNTSLASGKPSEISFPIPTYWDPCPGKTKHSFIYIASSCNPYTLTTFHEAGYAVA
jgi:hypothetical protein